VFVFDSEPPSTVDLPPGTRDIERMIAEDRGIVLPGTAQHVLISQSEQLVRQDRTFSVRFRCARESSHFVAYFVRVRRDSLAKTGQTPSLADLKTASIKRYRKLLGEKVFRELSRAVGLNAHGIGIGAFVYLRRVLEAVIETAHAKAAQVTAWDEGAYQRARVAERVRILERYLPEPLVSNTHVYGILSQGIHTLEEEECLRLFQPIQLGVELILDEEIQRRDKEKKTKAARDALDSLRVADLHP
jgi:hypothetical protein